MTDAYVYDAIPSPRGKGKQGGSLHDQKPMQLLTQLFYALQGASLLGAVLDELERRDLTTGLVSISGAAGIGAATIIERV